MNSDDNNLNRMYLELLLVLALFLLCKLYGRKNKVSDDQCNQRKQLIKNCTYFCQSIFKLKFPDLKFYHKKNEQNDLNKVKSVSSKQIGEHSKYNGLHNGEIINQDLMNDTRQMVTLLSKAKDFENISNIQKLQKQRPLSLINLGATCYSNSVFQGISAYSTFNKKISDISMKYENVKKFQVFKALDFENKSNIQKLQKQRPLSLINLGATCYLNSAFQGISACSTFNKEISDISIKYESVRKLQVFKALLDILNRNSNNHTLISNELIFQEWNKTGQQDSYEVLAYALNQVYNEIRKFKEDRNEIPHRDLKIWLQEKLPLRLIIKYEIVCGCSKVLNCPRQSDLALHITIPINEKNVHLNKLIDLYFGKDLIKDYQCQKAGCNSNEAFRQVKLCKPLPNTVCIHLQRTFWNGSTMIKLNKDVEFDTNLIIKSKFCLETVKNKTVELCNHSKAERLQVCNQIVTGSNFLDTSINGAYLVKNDGTKTLKMKRKYHFFAENNSEPLNKLLKLEDTFEIFKSEEEDEHYNLVSVIVHSGTVNGGHYICYKKIDKQWFLTNDSCVYEVSLEKVLNSQAYILFYERGL